MSKINHRREATAAARVLAKSQGTGAARKLDTKALRRAAKFVNRKGTR